MEIKTGNIYYIQTVPIPLHLLQTAEILNSFVCFCSVNVLVIVFNKNIWKIADGTCRRRWRNLFRSLAGISNALLSAVFSSQQVMRVFQKPHVSCK